MRLFGLANSKNKIPQSVDEPMAPIDLLYWSIYACLKSHAKDINADVTLELGMYLADNKLTIIVPKQCADVALQAAKECYILRNLKFDWVVLINDDRFVKLKEEAV